MATVDISIKEILRGAYAITWAFPASSASGDVGEAFDGFHLADKTVAVYGLATTNTSVVVIEGSNSGQTTGPWFTLTDPQDNLLSFPGADRNRVEQILEDPKFIRPRMDTATTSVAAFTIEMTAQSAKR